MAIEYYLRENRLTSDPNNYNAVVVSRRSATLDELIQMMIQQGSTLTAEKIRMNFEFMTQATIALLQEGYRVTTPVARRGNQFALELRLDSQPYRSQLD